MSAHGWQWVSCLKNSPSRRSNEDIDIILSKLKTMKVFEHYTEPVLKDLSRYALYDTFLTNVTLYRPGEEGLYWYAVIAGSLEMLDVDPNDSSKTTTICHLRDGDSFGENVILGTTRQTTIVTTDYCELLFVEAANMRQIYERHKDTMQGLLTTAAGSHDPGDTVDSGDRDSVMSVTESDLLMAGVTLHQLIRDHFSELISDHRVNMFTYRQCSSGRKMVDFVMTQSSAPRTRPQVIQMWQALLTERVIEHVNNEHPFRDDDQLYYRFKEHKAVPQEPRSSRRWSFFTRGFKSHSVDNGDDPFVTNHDRPHSLSSVTSSPRSSRSSLSSILDECFDTIASLGPETLMYATLRKDPTDRQVEELDLIYEELLHLRAFRHLSDAVKKELATCARLEHFKRAGKYVFRQGDKGDSWYVILKGSVNVVIQGKGVVCTLHEGDEFGKLALVNEAVRSSSIQVRESNSYFIRIERSDFRRILLSVESTNIRVVEHGKEVLLLEKASLGKYLVVKGTAEKILAHLLESELESGSQEDTFAQDFFLTYPAFISMASLCDCLRARYHGPKVKVQGVDETSIIVKDDENVRKRRVAEAIAIWIKTCKAELVKDTEFLQLLKDIQDGLAKDSLKEQQVLLNSSLADSIRSGGAPTIAPSTNTGHGFKRKPSSVQEHEIKLGISSIPAHSPQDKVPLRVHTIDRTLCRLQVRLDATAQNITEEACQKLDLRPLADYELCEVKSSGEKVRMNEKDISVWSKTSVNGRLFVLPKKHSEQVVSPLPDQNQIPITPFPDKDNSREVAAHLTAYDWNLLTNIQQMEYIYQLFGRHKFGKIVTNLDLLIKRFNEVQYWVITEVCREHDLAKRVALVKKFIKIAGYCKNFNNLNSFFAITIGLMFGAVTRLKQTWKEVPLRLRTRFEQFQALTDPSRNHKVLRAYQSKLSPPVIPFMPLVTKDAYFLNIGNETFIDGLVNFEKMRLVATSVRTLHQCKTGTMSGDVKALSNKNPSLQQYIRNLRVVDNDVVLTQMSHKIEPLETHSDSRTQAVGTPT